MDEKKNYYDRDGVGAGGMKIISPLRKLIETSKYGMRVHPVSGEEKMHYGIDYAAELNSPIFAIADGVVDFFGRAFAFLTLQNFNLSFFLPNGVET